MFGMFKKKQVPSQATALWAEEMNKYTPDMWQIQQHALHLVFVYGSMMTGHRQNVLLENSERGGTAFTVRDYAMVKKSLGLASFPIAFKVGQNNDQFYGWMKAAKVRGEVYLVPYTDLITLDNQMQNGVQFRRRKVWVKIPFFRMFRTKYEDNFPVPDEQALFVWMYTGIQSYWLNSEDETKPETQGKFSQLKSVNIIEPNSNTKAFRQSPDAYFYFTPKEYNCRK